MAGDSTVAGTGGQERSARQRLIDWANEQDGWVRSIVAEVITTRREVSTEALSAVRDAYLIEKHLAKGEALTPPTLGDDGGGSDTSDALVLRQLRECSGINALTTNQEIGFNPRMTVLFGENAAGKTGYVRILKLLANVRSAEAIIPDIHRPSTSGSPAAVVAYTLGENEDELSWQGDKGVPPFTRMTVFDSPAVALHLEDSVTYLYTPADLALFGYVHTAIDGVRTLLEEEIARRRPRQNPFLTAFARGTEIYPRIEALSGSSSLDELETLGDVTAEDRASLETLKLSVEALSGSASGQVEVLRTRARALKSLVTVGGALVAFDAPGFSVAVNAEDAARTAQTESAAAVFGGGSLSEDLHPAWQHFVEAGEQYLAAAGMTSYPDDDDSCIYCQQELGDSARQLLRSYRDFAGGGPAAALQAASTAVTTLRSRMLTSDVNTAVESLRAVLPGLAEADPAPDWIEEGQHVLSRAERVCGAVSERRPVPTDPDYTDWNPVVVSVSAALAESETTLSAVEGDAKQRAELLSSDNAKVALLEARLRLSQLLPDIRTYVEDSAWADRVRTLLGRFQGLLTGLTNVSKQASEDVLNHDFERIFYEECERLRAPTVTLDFPGRRGQAARRKSVARDHSLSDILSEGEQKVIAIADFLAEASLRTGSAPIIFDDPVNSFDYRRVREIAKRIAALSDEHQVIVFTHDIWFTSDLLAEFEQRSSDCMYYQIVDDGGAKGVVSRAAHPRLDSVASVRRRINTAIQDAEGGTDEDRQHRIDSAYSEIRAWCEVVVEGVLLNRVTQRHQPNVAMQNLSGIKIGALQTAREVIYPIWEKANRYTTAHSQPLGTLAVRPTVNELKEDWEALKKALADYEAA